jgi:prepilin-type N-terminal cleavage/methylation domain-containing protein
MAERRQESGFSIIELLVATAVLLIVSSIVTSALLQMTNSQKTIWNRTEMHSGIRGATELLEQEVGQAGRISTPAPITLSQAISAPGGASPAAAATRHPEFPGTGAATVQVSSVSGLFATDSPRAYEMMTTLDGDSTETIPIYRVAVGPPATIQACFQNAHPNGTVLQPMGGFATGIVPPTGIVNGSTGTVLKLYGDINADGNMVYVEYTCDTTAGKLYRNVMAFDAGSKPLPSDAQILLSNIVENPVDPNTGIRPPCFSYQTSEKSAQGNLFTFVLDVAVTLTVETDQIDPLTQQKQTETKALLNVSPRNVFNAWQLVNIGYTDRIQSTPASVQNLLGS